MIIKLDEDNAVNPNLVIRIGRTESGTELVLRDGKYLVVAVDYNTVIYLLNGES